MYPGSELPSHYLSAITGSVNLIPLSCPSVLAKPAEGSGSDPVLRVAAVSKTGLLPMSV